MKEFTTIIPILEIIDKSIPYPIIFLVQYEAYRYFSTAAKHLHPFKENISVLDWTFTTGWFKTGFAMQYQLNLKKSLDEVHKDFCLQISGKTELQSKPIAVIVEYEKQVEQMEKEIEQLQSQIKKCKQFNKKVELNLELRAIEETLKRIISN